MTKHHPHVVPTLPVDDEATSICHVYPMFGRTHEVDGDTCWCDPEFLSEHDGLIVIHNADN
jgi:hypothetical protein